MAVDDDDVLIGSTSHPVVTTLLIVGCLALLLAITLSTKQLGAYVNPETRSLLGNFQTTAVKWVDGNLPPDPSEVSGEGGMGGGFSPERDF